MLTVKRSGSLIGFVLALTAPTAAGLPPDFVDQGFSVGWNNAVGLTFAPDGRLFVWEKAGRVWNVDADGHPRHEPLVDISDEVGNWGDCGLLGFAIDPDFYDNGHIYLLYVVDHHHLVHFGTPSYNPAANEYYRATVGRLTRYTARAEDDFFTVDPDSRLALVGETIDSGFPILHLSHGIGSLAFGHDGSLLASCGDGASFQGLDGGGSVHGSYAAQALTEGIITPAEDVGAFRAQLVNSLNGKIIRIDPATGDGLDDNPFFDLAEPRSARSRVWALGLRNPFRFTVRPEPGDHDEPGSLYIGDVGWNTREDLNVAPGPGLNFGWPIFEGLEKHYGYKNLLTANTDAPNRLFGSPGCTQEHFHFQDLIIQDTLDPDPAFPNPCDATQMVPEYIPHFVHTRPAIEWGRLSDPARVGIFIDGEAAVVEIGEPDSPVQGPQFHGTSSTGGVWYDGESFPEEFHDTYLHGDFAGDWIHNFIFDESDTPSEVRSFFDGGNKVVAMAVHPLTGDLFYIRYGAKIRRVFSPDGNQPPTAVIAADMTYGTTPLTVQFTGSGSTDPEQEPLSFEWDFGDGSSIETDPDPGHVFLAPPGEPTPYTVTLAVTDPRGASDQTTIVISVNNTPPQVTILSPADGTVYPLGGQTSYDLVAEISDAEHDAGELACAWQTTLHHNDHTHPEPVDHECTTSTVVSPVGCDGGDYFYSITLTVTDAAGLFGSDEVILLPDCPGCPDIDGDGSVGLVDMLMVLGTWGRCPAECPADVRPDGVVDFLDLLQILSAWGPCG